MHDLPALQQHPQGWIPECMVSLLQTSFMMTVVRGVQDFAQWLVKSNVDLAHPPCDAEWNLEAIISQARCSH